MILQCKTALLYKYSRDNITKISAYSSNGISIKCSLQPVTEKDGLDGGKVLATHKLYTDYQGISNGDKIIVLGRTFIVNDVNVRDGLKRKYLKVLVNESIGN